MLIFTFLGNVMANTFDFSSSSSSSESSESSSDESIFSRPASPTFTTADVFSPAPVNLEMVRSLVKKKDRFDLIRGHLQDDACLKSCGMRAIKLMTDGIYGQPMQADLEAVENIAKRLAEKNIAASQLGKNRKFTNMIAKYQRQ